MPAHQTAYINNPVVGYAGMIADATDNTILSRRITTGAVAFGLAVGRGTGDGTARLGGTGYEGIAVADKAQPDGNYPVDAIAGVMVKGTIWVTASVNVAPGDTVYFVPATGVITNVLTGNTAIPNARFGATATAGNLVPLILL